MAPKEREGVRALEAGEVGEIVQGGVQVGLGHLDVQVILRPEMVVLTIQ